MQQAEQTRGMKVKTIQSVLSKKFNEFAASIDDDKVRQLVEQNTIITGGCITSMFLGLPVNDFDIYFTNKATAFAVAEYYVKWFKELHEAKHSDGRVIDIECGQEEDRVRIYIKSAGIASQNSENNYEYFERRPEDEAESYTAQVIEGIVGKLDEVVHEEKKDSYRPVFLSGNAITLSDKVQIIIRFFGEADKIHENFDYVHCTSYWLSADKKLYTTTKALQAILAKELVYVGSKYPIASILRMRKFIKRGWSINAGQVLKICFQISELDLKNVKVLEEQLVGVDVAYFNQLVSILEKAKESKAKENLELKIDAAYLTTIIDRLF
jgi:hypothetical protein